MSRTIRRTKVKGQKVADKDNSKFCRHDISPILKGMQQSQKAEEKQYFKKFEEVKYNQKPKSKGGTW